MQESFLNKERARARCVQRRAINTEGLASFSLLLRHLDEVFVAILLLGCAS